MSVKIVPYNASLDEASDALHGKSDSTYLFFKMPDVAERFQVVHLGVVGGGKSHFLPIGVRVSHLLIIFVIEIR